MIGLDTNVLVRYLTQDDPGQARRASALVEETVRAGERCYIDSVVLCELVWVLRGAYSFDKSTVVETLERILATAQFEIADGDVARRALADYRSDKGDYADYVIGRANQGGGCEVTATFDRQLRGHEAFRVLN